MQFSVKLLKCSYSDRPDWFFFQVGYHHSLNPYIIINFYFYFFWVLFWWSVWEDKMKKHFQFLKMQLASQCFSYVSSYMLSHRMMDFYFFFFFFFPFPFNLILFTHLPVVTWIFYMFYIVFHLKEKFYKKSIDKNPISLSILVRRHRHGPWGPELLIYGSNRINCKP